MRQILAHREWDGRLLNGSDYPLPGVIPLFSLNELVREGVLDAKAVPLLRDLRETNALLFDFVLKRAISYQGRRFPASAFETRPFFENKGLGDVEHSQFRLMRERRFASLFWTQFLGAANDNLFKFSFTLLATYHAAEWGGMDSRSVGFVIAAIFISPYILFSATSGQIADKIDKGSLMRFVKNLEIVIMAIAAYGFVAHHAMALYVSVFLMGLHSTLFGPVKYAYLPQHLSTDELTGGNGLVEMGTFVAILLGTMAGGLLVSNVVRRCHGVGVPRDRGSGADCLAVHPAIARPRARPQGQLESDHGDLAEPEASRPSNRAVFNSLLGISWLWFFGSVFLTSFTPFSLEVLHGDENVVTLLLAVFSFGIGLGSLLCERLSDRKIEIGLVPFGSIGMTLFAVDLWFSSSSVHVERDAGRGAVPSRCDRGTT